MRRWLLLTCVLGSACASAPSAFSARSPASPESVAAPRLTIGRALVEEPPAPGASTEGWAGLTGAPASSDAHAQHHHMMRMPDGTMMEMDAMPSMPAPEATDAH